MTIELYVSHRIDIKSYLPNCSLYVPMRCGAVYDTSVNPTIAGDDTGDNISDRRASFCELTVQYWAWKHAQADYIGLCHYRRYLSMIPVRSKVDVYGHMIEPLLDASRCKAYGIDNAELIKSRVAGVDAITIPYNEANRIVTPDGRKNTVLEHWRAYDGFLIKATTIDLLQQIVQARQPKYYHAMQQFLLGSKLRGYNCFIMRRDLFQDMCEFQFDVLFELEKQLDTSAYNETLKRSVGFMGEILFGTYMLYLEMNGAKVATTPLVRFLETRVYKTKIEKCFLLMRLSYAKWVRKTKDFLFPPGSPVRLFLIDAKKRVLQKKKGCQCDPPR